MASSNKPCFSYQAHHFYIKNHVTRNMFISYRNMIIIIELKGRVDIAHLLVNSISPIGSTCPAIYFQGLLNCFRQFNAILVRSAPIFRFILINFTNNSIPFSSYKWNPPYKCWFVRNPVCNGIVCSFNRV